MTSLIPTKFLIYQLSPIRAQSRLFNYYLRLSTTKNLKNLIFPLIRHHPSPSRRFLHLTPSRRLSHPGRLPQAPIACNLVKLEAGIEQRLTGRRPLSTFTSRFKFIFEPLPMDFSGLCMYQNFTAELKYLKL